MGRRPRLLIVRPWKDDIVHALTALGGVGNLEEIYAEIARLRKPLRGAWQATVRVTLKRNSADSQKAGRENLFYSVRGTGGGVWGLH